MHKITKIAEYGIIVKDNKFLMLKFSKATNPSEKWIFPGGRLDENENPKEALIREIKEETGLDVDLLFPCDVAMWGKNDDQRYAVFFLCTSKNNEVKLSHEHQDFKWFCFDELDKIDYHYSGFKDVLENARKLSKF